MKRIYFLLLILLFTLGLYWFYHHFDFVSVTYEVGLQGKARRYPFLAAHMLLKRMDIQVKESSVFPLVFSQKTVFLIHEDIPFKGCSCSLLYPWILQGGHLIIASTDLDAVSKRLFLLPVRLEKQSPSVQKNIPSPLTFGNVSLRILFDPHFSLKESSPLPKDFKKIREMRSQYGTHLITYAVGKGVITLLSDIKFLKKKTIGDYDHAQLLWHLVHLRLSKEILWIHLKEEDKPIPSLIALLWQYSFPVLISMMFILFSGLWYAGSRFGPLLPPPPLARRRFFEHIQASGRFLWQQGQSQLLLHHTRQALFNHLASSHPEWLHTTPEQLHRHLAQISGLPIAAIQESLELPQDHSPASFTRMTNTLAQLRRLL